MAESFWNLPDITAVHTPLGILREQADRLTRATDGRLVGLVEIRPGRADGDLILRLGIKVPAIEDYTYWVLEYRQPVLMYPGVLLAAGQPKRSVTSAEDFTAAVRQLLASDQTGMVVAALRAQASAATAGPADAASAQETEAP